MLVTSAVFLPLLGFLSTAFLRTYQKNKIAPLLCTFLMGMSFLSVLGIIFSLKFGNVHEVKLFTWFKIEHLKVNWGLFVDSLSLTMLLIVSIISFLVHIYSFGYMEYDKDKGKFFGLLSFFTFFMNILVTGQNLVQLFFGWEGVGLASYLLIGFWYQKEAPPLASQKAFIVNRVADVGLIAAIGLIFYTFETLEIVDILSQLCKPSMMIKTVPFFHNFPVYEVIGFCLLLGAMGKSAQFGLHTWLPDAMEGPTPVSALIHAATMVTAGVFLICRFSNLFEMTFYAKSSLLIIGTMTAFFGATVAMVQTDIKRIIAYSTCSQLGYMMMALGVSAYSVAIFHLVTHAFFKALLFLSAGSVIHAMSSEQNILKMGGLRRLIPFTFSFMMIGSLAISGIPFFAGFYSKDAILESVYNVGAFYSFAIGLVVVFLTAYYSWRLLILTFHGKMRNDDHVLAHVHESPKTMIIPLIILSLGAIFSGIIGKWWYIDQIYGFSWGQSIFLKPKEDAVHSLSLLIVPVLVALLAIVLAYVLYLKKKNILTKIKMHTKPIYKILYHKWYVDEFYQKVLVKPLLKMGSFFYKTGESYIDALGTDGFSIGVYEMSYSINKWKTSKMYNMLFIVCLFLCLILGGYLLSPYIVMFLLK
ncbi:MAG: NADH-quinone oxidoreductase subunit L [Proteobacteria bacterium]|nr:NADH-quinone oxidoreductase subunit L [Pseudomonadota bacterium]